MTAIQDSFNADLEEAKRRVQAGMAAGIPPNPVHPPDAVPDAPPPSAGKLGLLEQLYGPDLTQWKAAQLKEWLKHYKESTGHDALAGVVKPTTGDLMRIVGEAKAKLAGMPAGAGLVLSAPGAAPMPLAPPTPPVLTTAPQQGMPAGSQVLPGGSLVYPPVTQQQPVQTVMGWNPPTVTPPVAPPAEPIPADAARPVFLGAQVSILVDNVWRHVTVDDREVFLAKGAPACVMLRAPNQDGQMSWRQTVAYWPPGPAQVEGTFRPTPAPTLAPAEIMNTMSPAAVEPAGQPPPATPQARPHPLDPPTPTPRPSIQLGDEVMVTAPDGNLVLLKIDGQVAYPVLGSSTHVYVQGYDVQRQPTWVQAEVYWPAPIGGQVPVPVAPEAPPVQAEPTPPALSGNGQEGVSNFGQAPETRYQGGPDHQPDMNDPEQNPRLAGPPSGDSLVGGILRDHLGYDLFVDVIPQDRRWVDVLDLAQPTIAYWNAQLDKQKPPKGTEGQVGHYQLFEWQGGIGLVVGGVLNCIEQFQGLNIVVRTRTALGKALAEALAPRARERFEGVR